jgi:hypothetical protein
LELSLHPRRDREDLRGCGRTAELQANPIARMLRGDEIKALGERCELIKARLASVEGA